MPKVHAAALLSRSRSFISLRSFAIALSSSFASDIEYCLYCICNLVVGRTRASREADAQGTVERQPRHDARLDVLDAWPAKVYGVALCVDRRHCLDVISRHALSAQRRQRNGVARVE